MSIRKRSRGTFPMLLGLESRILFSGTSVLSPPPSVVTNTELTASTNAIQVGDSLTFTATVTPQSGAPLNGEWVQLWDAGTIFVASAQLVNGTATMTWTPRGGGLQSISAEFPAQDEFTRSVSDGVDINVFRRAAQLNLQATTNSPTSGVVHVTVTAASVDPLPFSPTGVVEILNGTQVVGTIQLGTGGGVNLHLRAGTYDLRAEYSGDGAFFPAQAVEEVVIAPLPAANGGATAASSSSGTASVNAALPAVVISANGSLSSSTGDGAAFHLDSSTLPPESKQFYEFHLPPALDPSETAGPMNAADLGGVPGAFSEKSAGATSSAAPTPVPPGGVVSQDQPPVVPMPTAFSQAR